MKQFIYLDTDIVNSIIAQNDNGLIQNVKKEKSSVDSNDKNNMISANFDSGIKGGIFNVANVEAKLNLDAKIGEDKSVSNTTRQILEKTMHDASFDIAYSYINTNKIMENDRVKDNYGKYIELTRIFDFVDLNYLNKLFSNDGIIDFLKETTREQIKVNISKTIDNLNREQRRSQSNKIENVIKKAINENNKKFDNISETINVFRKMIPYSRMLISNDGYLIPLDEKYFRVNPTSIGFMYGGNITCVGMITNIIGKGSNPQDDKNIFANLQFLINEVLRSILPTKSENICVIHPIAIYYNN